ncbi:MAG: lipid IV(A) 3-deoxy-D-manno-octulosonic acid transferase [Pseudomonadota bacterium]
MWPMVYRFLLLFAAPFVRLRLRRRARQEPAYGERIEERFGVVPDSVPQRPLWFHAVSAGETIGAAPLIERLMRMLADAPVLVTTMTPTGAAQVRSRLPVSVAHCYAPYDFPAAVRAFYDQVQPRILVLMETELWPNLLGEARRRGVPVVLINGRLSERSARGYARFASLTRPMFETLTLTCCQYPAHRERFAALGVPRDRIRVTGNVKFDQTLPPNHGPIVNDWRRQLGLDGRWIWIAASTHDGEDAPLLDAHQRLLSQWVPGTARPLLLLVPRHPARVSAVVEQVAATGCSHARLSELRAGPELEAATQDVIVGDTMGDLLTLYALARIAFVGGSLVPVGGHNPIEPALCGVPLLFGPSRFNFQEVCERFERSGALVTVADAEQLVAALRRAIDDPAATECQGQDARAVVDDEAGVLLRLQTELLPLLDQVLDPPAAQPASAAR